jgi:hypothetical protein
MRYFLITGVLAQHRAQSNVNAGEDPMRTAMNRVRGIKPPAARS